MKKILLTMGACLFACTLHAYIDLNYNGLSDVWEFIYFNGPADPYADSDGDGVSNYDEMIWGTDPTDPTSKVTGPTATLTGKNLRFSWFAAPYRNYELRASEDLVTWHTLASGAISNYTENLSAASAPARRFYRLSVSFQATTQPATILTATRAGSNLVLTWMMDTNSIYDLLASGDFLTWNTLATNTTSPYANPITAMRNFYRLKITGGSSGIASDGLDAWEEALYVQKFGVRPIARDSDGDGVSDLQEFQLGLQPGKKDNPAVGLVVFTPLEK